MIHDFNVFGSAVSPHEANSPSIVGADAVLTCAAAFEQLKAISRRRSQIRQSFGLMDLSQLALRRPLKIRVQSTCEPAMEQRFGITIGKRANHAGAYIRTAL